MKSGDFTELAKHYAEYRSGYSPEITKKVLSCILSRSTKTDYKDLKIADVGAGTGIWTRLLAKSGATIDAVEPNDAMRENGIVQSEGIRNISWRKGSAENTTLNSKYYDGVCMASAFHWADFEKAITEFNRILKDTGVFVALWKTRYLELNPLLVEIEDYLLSLVPELKNSPSAHHVFCDSLYDHLVDTKIFSRIDYIEGIHCEHLSKEQYMGLWKSVNDIRVKAGEERFTLFLDFVSKKIAQQDEIIAHYKTICWLSFK